MIIIQNFEKFNELYNKTYRDAAHKLAKLGHPNRAKVIAEYGKEHGISKSIPKLELNKFHIKNDEIGIDDDTFQIIDLIVNKYNVEDGIIYSTLVRMMNDEHDVVVVFIKLNNGKIYLYISKMVYFLNGEGKIYYSEPDDTQGGYGWPSESPDYNFKFIKRKDAVVYKNFIINDMIESRKYPEALEGIKKIPINQLYSD